VAPILKQDWEIEIMRQAGRIAARAMQNIREILRPGLTTKYLDECVERFILSCSAWPTFKGYRGFPASACISVNDEVVHGIPDERVLKEGDIVSLDIAATYKNYVGDLAATLPVGKVSENTMRLIDTAKGALDAAISVLGPYVRLSLMCATIQNYVESRGYSVVKKYVGHGIGSRMHEDPQIPNYLIHPIERFDVILKPGMVIAVEPMVNEGTDEVRTLKNRWTVVTKDGKLSAHFEHTVAIREHGYDILTLI
jgi:methionyl aminopeptidase